MAYDESKIDYKNAMIIDSLPGVSVQVLFEFPDNSLTKSFYFIAMDIISVSHSSSRSKIPVINLGQVSPSGIALGTRVVAGSIIKLFHRNDSLTHYIKTFVDARFEQLHGGNAFTFDDVESNITFKEFSDYLADDISPFNIHLIHLSEPTANPTDNWGAEWKPRPPRVTSIIGCTIINTGKVFSVENLVTEETLSFIAKNVIYSTDNLHPEKTSNNAMTGSKLLGMRSYDENVPQSIENYRSFAKGFVESAGYENRELAFSGYDGSGRNNTTDGSRTTNPYTGYSGSRNQNHKVSNANKKDPKSSGKPESITYTLKPGDSLSKVAKANNVTLTDLVKWNGIKNPDKVKAGARVIIQDPTTAKTVEQQEDNSKTQKQNEEAQKDVQPVSEDEFNKLADKPVEVDQSIIKPYKVKRGDTLANIAKSNNLDWKELAKLNNIKEPDYIIRVGQELKLR